MKPMNFFTPLRLAAIAVFLVVGAGSAVALSPALRNFFFDAGLNADERAAQTQAQLDEEGIAGTATPTSAGDVHIKTDGANASRLLQLMERLTVVTPDGESTEVATGLKDVAKRAEVPLADSVEIVIGTAPNAANQPPKNLVVEFDFEGADGDVTSEQLRAELKARGVADDLIELIVQKYEATQRPSATASTPR